MPVVTMKELKALLPQHARMMGIDHGSKTIGMALSNPELTIATPFKTLERVKFTENIKQLSAICKEYSVHGFVIGLPLHMDGSSGKRVEQVKSFGNNLMNAKDALGFDPLIVYWDERLSTFAVESFLIEEVNMSRKRRDEVVDKLAAQHILQSALNSLQEPGMA